MGWLSAFIHLLTGRAVNTNNFPISYVHTAMKNRSSTIVLVCCIVAIMLLQVSGSRAKDVAPAAKDSTYPPTLLKPKSYLALGDSYTIGQSIDSQGRYPAQAASLLLARGISIPVIHYIAVTGWTTLNLQNAIAAENLTDTFDMVTLLIGVNDQYQGVDTGTYTIRFTQLLQTSVTFARGNKSHVVVISIPDYGVTQFGDGNAAISAQIDEFNAINKRVTDAAGIAYLNLTTLSRAAATDNTLLASDGLHYSPKEYLLWADTLAPMMYNALK